MRNCDIIKKRKKNLISVKEINEFINKITQIKKGDFSELISKTRDVFDARLVSYTSRTQNWLLGAVIGEIGANTFDHNFSFRTEVPKGVFCDFDSNPGYIFLCDFGVGLKTTLSRVLKEIDDDSKAIETAFTKPISGRAPEMRGNGLKFVIKSVVENQWNLFFQSGNAVCNADKNGYSFEKSDYNHDGCFCIISCKE
ncbi:hypothetical protein [Treponema ruminis]|uniref:hypothetical protein n=1 Tax=Treponema ruminis TaxID=744515 RepID=UPI00197E7B8F|nr:hypothetical protein [Treponema ruminis]